MGNDMTTDSTLIGTMVEGFIDEKLLGAPASLCTRLLSWSVFRLGSAIFPSFHFSLLVAI